jgi:hypothetical protein
MIRERMAIILHSPRNLEDLKNNKFELKIYTSYLITTKSHNIADVNHASKIFVNLSIQDEVLRFVSFHPGLVLIRHNFKEHIDDFDNLEDALEYQEPIADDVRMNNFKFIQIKKSFHFHD